MTEKSCGIVYELVQVCLQAKWPEADKSSLVLTKAVDCLVEQQGMVRLAFIQCTIKLSVKLLRAHSIIYTRTNIDDTIFQTNFLGYMVDYIRCVIGLNSEPLTEVEASDQVTLYHISFVLNTLIRYSSPRPMRILRERLVEEFR